MQIGLQAAAGHVRSVTIDAIPPCGAQLVPDDGVSRTGTGDIHELAQPQGFRPGQHFGNCLGRHFGAGTLLRAGGHAGRRREANMQGEPMRGGPHGFEPGQSGDIRDLVGIGYDGPSAAGDDRPGEFGHPEERAFGVDVRVDKRRGDDLAPAIDDLVRAACFADIDDAAVSNRDGLFFQFSGEDIEHLAAGQHGVGLSCSPSGGDPPPPAETVETGHCLSSDE